MINVRTKTTKEIEEQESLYRFGAAVAKGIPMTVCKTYLMKKDGTKVDTRDLSEQEILGLIANDLKDYSNPNGTYKTNPRTGVDSFKLADAIRDTYTPSIDATIQLYQMKEVYGHIVADLMGSLGSYKISDKAETIARFNKESNGDFSPVETQELISVLQQMSYNEQMRKQQSSKRR